MNKYYTYQLIDPTTNLPFYVGKGCGNRMYKHVKDVKLGKIPNKTNHKLFKKIREILDCGNAVVYEKLIETDQELEALALESAFIDFYGLDKLCNYLKSWFGISHKRKETRIKQSLAHKGKKSYMYGIPKTEEQKRKNREAHLGENNYRYIWKKYKFYNEKMGLVEFLTPYEFRQKYKLDSGGLHRLLNKKRMSIKGWTLEVGLLSEIESIRRNKIKEKLTGKPKSESHRKNLWKNRK